MLKLRSRPQAISAGLALLLAAIAILAILQIGALREHQRMRVDLAELNGVKYGLLNADAWVQQVTAIIDKKIKEFELTPENRKAIKRTLQRMLDVLITEADRHLRKQRQKGDVLDKVKQDVQDTLVDLKEVKAGIPGYADQMLVELEKPKARRDLDDLIKNLLEDVSESTYALMDQSLLEAIHAKYQCNDRASCQQSIRQRIERNHLRAVWLTLTLLALTALLFAAVWSSPGKPADGRLALLALCSFVLMLCGVLTPMIEVEARISELRFVLLGEPVVFTDQVLYFQSKSVLDVVQVLTATGKLDMIVVGILIMTFSVIFPLAKLAASLVYLYLGRWRQTALVRFFALKSGKWSMADVFVVAMFMAYIGFNGVIESQLSNFAAAGGEAVDVLTTNGTSLQIGFFMFLAFCLAGLMTSTLIDAATGRDLSANGDSAS